MTTPTEKTYVIPVSNGILTPEHHKRIGPALWLFLWFIDKCTSERRTEDGGLEGLVLGGKALTAEHIAREAGESVRSVRYHVKRLEDHGYIRRLVHPGLASGYAVIKSKKFRRTAATPARQELGTSLTKNSHLSDQNLPRNKEDITQTVQGHKNSTSQKPVTDKTIEVAQWKCVDLGLSATRWSSPSTLAAFDAALQNEQRASPWRPLTDIADALGELWNEYVRTEKGKGQYAMGPAKFFGEGWYARPATWRDATSEGGTVDGTAFIEEMRQKRALAQAEADAACAGA